MSSRDPRDIEALLSRDASGLRDQIVGNLGDFTVALLRERAVLQQLTQARVPVLERVAGGLGGCYDLGLYGG